MEYSYPVHFQTFGRHVMFGYKTLQALRARLWSDQREAASEQRRALEQSQFVVQCSENARQNLEVMFSDITEEFKERNEQQRVHKFRLLQEYSDEAPQVLVCDREPFSINGHRLFEYSDDTHCWYVIWIETSHRMLRLCTVMTRDTWAIVRTASQGFYDGQDPSPESDTVLVDSLILTLEDVHSAVRKWLSQYTPTLSHVPIQFYPDEAMGSMSMVALAQRTTVNPNE